MTKTTIQITDAQKSALDDLKQTDGETYRSVLQRLIDSYESDDVDVTEARAREIAEAVVADRVVPEAQR
jgi:dihydroneopterin aldolase